MHWANQASNPMGKGSLEPYSKALAEAFGSGCTTASMSHFTSVAAGSYAVFQKILPVRSQKAMRPRAHTSAAGRTSLPDVACSGAIQNGEPRGTLVTLDAVLASAAMRAMPKSRTLI